MALQKPYFKTESTDLSVDWDKPVICMSMGAGVQTTAQLLRDPQRYANGFIIFADTGDEKAETYWYIENYLKPFCKKHNLRWITVRHPKYKSIMERSIEKKTTPIRSRRWCTIDFKIKPIHRFLRYIGASRKNPVIEDLGISIDESHRANFSKKDVQYIKKEWPLIDANLSRRDCHEIIKSHDFPAPVKSGCDFCPFTNRKELRKLSVADPERFLKIVHMEKNDRKYPKKYLIGKYPLENMILNTSLDSFNGGGSQAQILIEEEAEAAAEENGTCETGHCFR